MLTLALTLNVLAAAPGFSVVHSVDLVTQVDERLPKWLIGGGDRKALLATPKQLETYFLSVGLKPTEVALAAALKEQEAKAELQQFTATKVLLEYAGKAATVHFFDDAGHRCEVALFNVGTEAAQRYVLLGGPRTDSKTIESQLERGREAKSMLVFEEKKDGAWFTGSLPMPPPPDCATTLKKALETIFTSEKAYFAEHDAYSPSLSKVGVDVKSLGVSAAKVSVKGAAPTQTFVIEVGLRSGVMQMNEKGEITEVGACP